MKKNLLTFLLMLVGMTAFAQWDNPYNWELDYNAEDYPDISYAYGGKTPFYVQLVANGEVVNDENFRIAAFIEESCRALYAFGEYNSTTSLENGVCRLFVFGNAADNESTGEESDLNKQIVIGVYYRNLLFEVDAAAFDKELKFNPESTYGTPSNPLKIYLDIPTGVSVEATDEAVDFPYSKDMSDTWEYVYMTAAGAEYTPMKRTALMTELTPSWDPGQMGATISFEEQKLTVNRAVEGHVILKIKGTEYVNPGGTSTLGDWFEIGGAARVKFTQAEHPVTSITLTKQSIVVNKSPNLILGRELSKYITINPENATNKDFTLSLAEDVPAGYFGGEGYNMTPIKGTGENYYKIIISSVSNPEVTASIWVKIYAPVEDIQTPEDGRVTINKGDNIYEALRDYITVLPEDATDKSYTLTPQDEDAFVDDIAVRGSGINEIYYGIIITSNDNPNLDPRVIDVFVNAAPTTITCDSETIQMDKGQHVEKMLTGHITVGPEDATNQEWTYEFYSEDSPVDVDGCIARAGLHKVKVFCPDFPEVTTDIYINVAVRPERIYLSNETYSYRVPVGTDIFEMLRGYVTFDPEDATETDYEFIVSDDASDAIVDGIARREGNYRSAIQIVSAYSENIRTYVSIEIYVAVEDIIVPDIVRMEVGQSLYYYFNEGSVNVIPEEANQSFTLEYSQNAFDGNGNATATGNYTVTVRSVADPTISKEVSVEVVEAMKFTYPAFIEASKREETTFELTCINEGLGIDPDKLEIYFSGSDNDWGYTPNIYMSDESGLQWTIEPSLLAGYYTISVYYDGEEIESDEPGMNYCEVAVAAEASFKANGWDWIYVPGSIESIEEALADYNIDENNKVIEIRSQTAMLYNDPEYGFFGDIYGMGSWDGMYKIKSTFEDDSDRYIKAGYYWDQCYKTVYRGYNWIGYGNEWDMTIGEFNELNEVNQFGEGDFILSKDGIAVFDAEYNEWIASDNFMFEVGKGYIFYFANRPNMEIISFESYPHILFPRAARVKARKPENKSVWEFDASQFADNMAVVAELKNVDIPENYTVGAFVDGECRGMGKVAKNGIMLISVAGKAGEQVSFRLHNEMTGEFSEVKETTSYKMIAGSLKAPFSLTADGNGTTDINGIGTVNDDDIVAIYTLGGQRVEEMTEGNIYIVQVRVDGKIVTKKVKK